MTQDVAKVAEGLTKAQRKALDWCASGHVLLVRNFTRWRLVRKGLIDPFLPEFFGNAGWQPSKLGLAVRAHLLDKK